MKTVIAVAAPSFFLLLILGAMAGEEKPGTPAELAPPATGPEHALLAKSAGVWDATVKDPSQPGAPGMKGVETSTLACGGLWLITDFQGETMGQPFQGHGVTGYDPGKKKYTGIWVDGMSPTLGMVEGTYDAATKTMSYRYEGRDPAGNPVRMKMVTVWKGEDRRVWTASMVGEDGKDIPVLAIEYERRK